MNAQARDANPCLDREFPLAVTANDGAGLAFDVNEADTVPQCKNPSVTLRNVGENRLVGKKSDGLAVRLGRQSQATLVPPTF